MGKFTAVIPTLWQSKRIHGLLNSLVACPNVDEIILIDNNNRYSEFYEEMKKVKVFSPSFNIYVNPAWNYGVKYARNKSIALINDDIKFDTRIFERFSNEVELKLKGFVGMSSENYEEGVEYNPTLEPWKGEVVLNGWGCLILFNKDHWLPIPEELKIWYGDNFIRNILPAPSHILKGLPIQTEMSTTSDQPRWNKIKDDDARFWIENFKVEAHERIKKTIDYYANL